MAYGGRITKIMKENSSQMLFAELGIPVIEKTKVIQWINSVPEKQWIWNAYRNCYLLPVMTKNGKIQEKDFTHSNLNIQNFIWAKNVPDFIKKYFEEHVFSWAKTTSRIAITCTMPEQQNPVHIDCSPKMFNVTQHKFRIVIQGCSDTLYFKTRKGKIWAPLTNKPFIIDGSWPHGMINNSKHPKYTLCFGSPWSYSDSYPGLNPLLFVNKNDLPGSYYKYFNPKYKI